MRKFLICLCLLAVLPCARAQFGSFGDIPVEITADGNTRFEEGVAIAEDEMLPAPAQGAVGIEILSDNARVRALLDPINDAETFTCVLAERAFLATLSADCHSPVAAQARLVDGKLHIRGEILTEDGSMQEHGASDDPATLARALLDRAPPRLRAIFG
jgi:hydroxymethylbilane synthase